MSNYELLNNVNHADLKVATGYSAEFGDNVNSVLTFPSEFSDIQREYPILFKKDRDNGTYQSIALLGFAKGENLFLQGNTWKASYVPGVIARGPFAIGFQEQEVEGETRKEPVVHVDLSNRRISQDDGEPVFLPQGGNSPYLNRVTRILNGIREGMAVSRPMFAAFDSLGLIEPVNIEVEIHAGERYNLPGYYTISEEKLAQLSGEELATLNKQGFLFGAFLVIASLGNLNKLIEMKRQQLAAPQSE